MQWFPDMLRGMIMGWCAVYATQAIIKTANYQAVRFAAAGFWLAALGPWAYDYYMLLRVIVCVAAALLAFLAYRSSNELAIWCGVFAALAIRFNPFFLSTSRVASGPFSISEVLSCLPLISLSAEMNLA